MITANELNQIKIEQELKVLEGELESAAKNGSSDSWWYQELSDDAIEFLRENGYTVEGFPNDENEGTYKYCISGW
jgi:hypothetical protein